MRIVWAFVAAGTFAAAFGQTVEWPAYGHDAGGTRYSPAAQITAKNVAKLRRAWTYHTGEKGRTWETTPIVVNHVLYFSTPSQRIVALDPESGKELWTYASQAGASDHRGVSYWPGNSETPARIFFGTSDGRLMALDAKTGKPVGEFGQDGVVDLRIGVADKFPRAAYRVSSPPAIYRDLVIVGPSTQEGPSLGPSGDVRAFDARTGKPVWRFHTVPQPGEPGNETWGPNGWKDRSGPSAWGFITVDQERGTVFVPVGNPADSFYGADRKGTNLYSDCVLALDAATGKLRWYYQLVHHDLFDYDLAAAPALIDVKRDGRTIPAVAQITKMGLLFILDRTTGKPVFGVEERPVPKSDVPGEESWPTQPFPIKPPPLARMTMKREELTDRTPEAARFCGELFDKMVNLGPYTPIGSKPSLRFPGTMGGGNWGGVSFDAKAGLVFVNTSSLGGMGSMVPARAGSPVPYRNEGGYVRFVDQDGYPCQKPPWGEMSAVNVNTGEIAWRVPLGSYPALEGSAYENKGTINMGGSIATAGGVVFVGATLDARLRAFDSQTGKEVWAADIGASADATPITYQGRDGRQYVVVAAGGPGRFRGLGNSANDTGDSLIAFALPGQ
ncbi:MAG TPA: pyrroloquinoline quinone-dependent dehydrogenase [Bryobacteraceae bacterium]